ncbi:MAG: CDP-diacylglycerol--glycerol-3-phosphate 3-phosphatidyltransferase [Pseudomonadota bacterium]
MIWTIPNILTMGRLVAAPCVALVFVFFDRPLADWLALGLFAAAAITDFFDGWLARKLNQTSELGKMLDPIADKAMVIIALAALLARKPVVTDNGVRADLLADWIMIPAIIIIAREVMISGLREFLGDVKLPVTRMAKYKTTVQMIAIGLLFGGLAFLAELGGQFHIFDDSGINFADDTNDGLWAAGGYLMLAGLGFLWLAALLTVITGWDYFRKGLAYIQGKESR